MKLQSHNFTISIILIIIFLINPVTGQSQDRIFSIGYAQNFINEDSSNFSFSIDLNRIPGKSEAGGNYLPVNEPVFEEVNFFIKPTADVNLGSYTTLAANNVSVGFPIGLSRLLLNANSTVGVLWGSFEIGPDFIADKSFDNYLYYASPSVNLNYSFTSRKQTVIDLGIGLKYGFGKRLQNVTTKVENSYRKYIIPVGIAINAIRSKDETYHHIKFSGIYKFNYLLEDDSILFPKKGQVYTQLKFDYYFTGQIGINITYTAGYEEPLFKKVNSIAIGITLARNS